MNIYNNDALRMNLDILNEHMEVAAIRRNINRKRSQYTREKEGYYNKHVKPYAYKVSDYVLRNNDSSRV